MQTRTVELPEDILRLLDGSRLGKRPDTDRVSTALAIHLFQEGVVSLGRAAELAHVPRLDFEWLLVQMGIPTVRYDIPDYEQDLHGIAEAERSGSGHVSVLEQLATETLRLGVDATAR